MVELVDDFYIKLVENLRQVRLGRLCMENKAHMATVVGLFDL